MGNKPPKINIDEQRYRVLIEHAPEVVLILDVESGRFIDANPAAIRLLKFSREELLQLGPSDISPALYQGVSAADKAQAFVEQALQGSNPIFDWVHVDREGQQIPCEIRLIRFPPYDKAIVRASIIDLSERRKMQTALTTSEVRLQLALKATGLGCYEWHRETNHLHWDERMYELFGLDPDADIDPGDYYMQAVNPDDLARITTQLQAITAPGSKEYNFEHQYRITRDQETIYLSSNGIIMRNASGQAERIIGTAQDITNRVRVREKLEHQATLLNRVSDAVIETDASFVVRSWNKAAEALYGWTPQEAIGQVLTKIVRVEYAENSREEVIASFMQDGYWRGDVIQYNKRGEELYVTSSVTMLRDENGKMTGSIGINRDNSGRRQAELALRESEARYRSLVEHFPKGVIALFDEELRYTLIDGERKNKLGIDHDSIIGKRLRDVYSKRIYERDEPAQRAALGGETTTRIVPIDGGYFYSVTTLPVRDKSGQIIAGLEFSQDITTQIEAEKALSKTLEQLQLAIDTAELGIWQHSLATDELDVNDRLLEIYGLDPTSEDLSREQWRHQIHPEDKAAVQEDLAKLFQGNPLPKSIFRAVHPDGTLRHIQAAARPIFDKEGKLIELVGINIDITNIKKNADALQEREAFLRAVIDNSLNAVLVADDEGRLQSFNQATCQMLGYSEADLSSMKLTELPIANIPDTEAWFQEVLTTGKDIGEFVLSLGDQLTRTVQYYVVHVKQDFNLCVLVDITERKQAEIKLQESEEKFSKSFQENPSLMILVDFKERTIIDINKAYCDLIGFSREEMINIPGKLGFRVIKTRSGNTMEEVFDIVAEQDRISNYEVLSQAKSGQVYSLMISAEPVRIQNRPLHILSAVNISELKRAEEALRKAKDYAENLIDAANVMIIGLDVEGTIKTFNKAAQDITGYYQEEVIGKNWFEIVVPRTRYPQAWEAFEGLAKRGGDMTNFENPILTKWGEERIISWQNSVLHAAGEVQEILSFGMDITEQKEAEQVRIRARQLEIRNRELEQFAYVASHDLQEPLRTISSFVGLLEYKYNNKLDRQAQEYVQFVVDAAARMSELIKGLLDYSRIGSNRELSRIDTNTLVAQILDDLAAQISSTGAIIERSPLPVITGYETELRMLFQNLISNAIKFRKENQSPNIRIGVAAQKAQWVFSVEDDGIGIDPIFQDQIFVLFQRLHGREEYEGTGIGLAHCQKIAELHGGAIWVESEVDKGSTFYFSIANSEQALD